MNRNTRKATAFTLVLLASTILLAALSSVPASAQTTDQAVVVILASAGGTTTPAPGNYTYDNGTVFNLAATPDPGFQFAYWVVSGQYTPGHLSQLGSSYIDPDTGQVVPLLPNIDVSGIDSLVFSANPAAITCGFGYTYSYQAVFAPTSGTPTATPPPQTEPATSTSAVVNILPAVGGTSDPAPGTYSFENGTTFTISANADSGFVFHYWIVTGSYTPGHLALPNSIPDVTDIVPNLPNIYQPTIDSVVFSINPATITCGFGYTYSYQPVFNPINATVSPIPTTTPTATQTPVIITTPTLTATPVVTETPSASVTSTPSESSGGLSTTVIAIIVAVIIIIIIVVAVVALMHRKK